MKNKSVQDLVFYFLKRIDYNLQWDKIEQGVCYFFRDYNFKGKKDIVEKVTRLAKHNWIELYGYFDEKGN